MKYGLIYLVLNPSLGFSFYNGSYDDNSHIMPSPSMFEIQYSLEKKSTYKSQTHFIQLHMPLLMIKESSISFSPVYFIEDTPFYHQTQYIPSGSVYYFQPKYWLFIQYMHKEKIQFQISNQIFKRLGTKIFFDEDDLIESHLFLFNSHQSSISLSRHHLKHLGIGFYWVQNNWNTSISHYPKQSQFQFSIAWMITENFTLEFIQYHFERNHQKTNLSVSWDFY